MYALAADSDGTLYAGGGFTNLENIAAADNVAYLPAGGTGTPMGAGAGPCGCAVTTSSAVSPPSGPTRTSARTPTTSPASRRPTTSRGGTGRRGARVGADSGGANGWFPAAASINALVGTGSHLFATGTFQDANGDARADNIAFFDGTDWHPVGSDGAGNGPWIGNGLALALVDRQLYAAGSFTSAGGDPQAHSVASFALTQIIAYPTPTVTAGPGPSRRPR